MPHMTYHLSDQPTFQASYRVEIAEDRFHAFLDAIFLAAALDAPQEDGVHELRNDAGPVSVSLSRPRRFLAVQLRTAVSNLEAFFICPSAKPAQCGIRVSEGGPPAWWTSFLGGRVVPEATAPNPSFLQLTCLLASNGSVKSSGPDHLVRMQELASEVDYLQALLREQSEDLRRAKSTLYAYKVEAAVGAGIELQTEEEDAPTDLAALSTWCIDNEERIVVLPRARKGAKKALYEHPQHIYEALEILAGPYRDLRRGQLDLKAFEQALGQRSLAIAGSAGISVAGEEGDTYFVSWGGRRRFLEFHIGRGGGRNERYCMRVYFFWDDVSQRAIVGDLPRHLENSLT